MSSISDPDDRLRDLAHSLDEAAPPVTNDEATNYQSRLTAVPGGTTQRRGRLGFVAAAAAVLAIAGIGISVVPTTDDTEAGLGAESGSAQLPDNTVTSTTPATVPADPARAILAGPAGVEADRYVRLVSRTEGADNDEQRLIEHWSSQDDGSVVAAIDISEPTGSDSIDPERTVDLTEERAMAEVGPSTKGFPELGFAPGVAELAEQLRSQQDIPASFMSYHSGGPDSAMFDDPTNNLAIVRDVIRLAPHTLESSARENLFALMAALDNAQLGPATDRLDRTGDGVSILFNLLNEPGTTDQFGTVTAVLIFDPDTKAILEVRWVVEIVGQEPNGLSSSTQTLTVIAAGEVAEIPRQQSEGPTG